MANRLTDTEKNTILNYLDSLTLVPIEVEDGVEVRPWFCMMKDIQDSYGTDENELIKLAEENGYIIFKLPSVGYFEGGLAIAHPNLSLETIKAELIKKAEVDELDIKPEDIEVIKLTKDEVKEEIEKKEDVKYNGYTISHFPMQWSLGDTQTDVESYIILSPYYFELDELDKDGNKKRLYLPLYAENEKGDVLNFNTEEDAKKYIDDYMISEKGKFEVKHGDECHYVIKDEFKSEIEESIKEELYRVSDEDLENLEKKLDEAGFKIVKKYDYDKKIHYQIISKNGNQDDDSFDEAVNFLNDLLDEFEDETTSPCTFNLGLQDDGYISAGIDVRPIYVSNDGEDRVYHKPDTISFKNGEPADEYSKNYLKGIANKMGMDYDTVKNSIGADKPKNKKESKEDVDEGIFDFLKKKKISKKDNKKDSWYLVDRQTGRNTYGPFATKEEAEDAWREVTKFSSTYKFRLSPELVKEGILTEKPDIFGIETDAEIDAMAKERKKQAYEKRKQIIDADMLTYLHNYSMLDSMAKYDNLEDRKKFLIDYITREVSKDREPGNHRYATKDEYIGKSVDKEMVAKMADYILDHYKNSSDFKRGLKFEPKIIVTKETPYGKFELKQVNQVDYQYLKDGKFWQWLNGRESDDAIKFFNRDIDKFVADKKKREDNTEIYKGYKIIFDGRDYIINTMNDKFVSMWGSRKDGIYNYIDKKLLGESLNESEVEEDIEKHDTLNPVLFDENELKPEIKEAIQKIVDTFVEDLKENEIALDIKDIVLVGSNVSYNYTKDSDLDVHIIVDSSVLDCPKEIADKLYSAYRSIFNRNYDIIVKGIPVELYVELDNLGAAKSNGIYSLNTGWIKEPVQQDIPDLDRDAFDSLFNEWEQKYIDLVEKEDLTSEDVKKFIEEIYELRKSNIASDGEYSLGNLVFKEFRNLGYLDMLKDLRKELKGQELSLEGLDKSSEKCYNNSEVSSMKETCKFNEELNIQQRELLNNLLDRFNLTYDNDKKYTFGIVSSNASGREVSDEIDNDSYIEMKKKFDALDGEIVKGFFEGESEDSKILYDVSEEDIKNIGLELLQDEVLYLIFDTDKDNSLSFTANRWGNGIKNNFEHYDLITKSSGVNISNISDKDNRSELSNGFKFQLKLYESEDVNETDEILLINPKLVSWHDYYLDEICNGDEQEFKDYYYNDNDADFWNETCQAKFDVVDNSNRHLGEIVAFKFEGNGYWYEIGFNPNEELIDIEKLGLQDTDIDMPGWLDDDDYDNKSNGSNLITEDDYRELLKPYLEIIKSAMK